MASIAQLSLPLSSAPPVPAVTVASGPVYRVVDAEQFMILDGPISDELVAVCARSPFGATIATLDRTGTWQHVPPRLRRRLRSLEPNALRTVFIESIAE